MSERFLIFPSYDGPVRISILPPVQQNSLPIRTNDYFYAGRPSHVSWILIIPQGAFTAFLLFCILPFDVFLPSYCRHSFLSALFQKTGIPDGLEHFSFPAFCFPPLSLKMCSLSKAGLHPVYNPALFYISSVPFGVLNWCSLKMQDIYILCLTFFVPLV